MNIEMIGEKEYMDTIRSKDQLWILMAGDNAYVLNSDDGNALPTWHTQAKVLQFLSELNNPELKTVSVPLGTFINSWLNSAEMGIVEIIASPRYGFPGLTYTSAEYASAAKT